MKLKEDLIASRTYQKGEQFQSLFVREASGGEINGIVFQFETWKNNVEVSNSRISSGDIYYVRNRYFAKLLKLLEEGWKKTNVEVFANPHCDLFNPEVL
jgi:hypothetical protein